jgi:acetylornithine deacetylase/succinyl-diaminopimelate desuccinylase-like protein
MAISVGDKNVYTVQTAEKGIHWFKIRAKGRPGHGSVPGGADNAIMRMNEVIGKLGNHRSKIMLTPTVEQYLTEMAKADKLLQSLSQLLQNPEKSDQLLDILAKQDNYLAEEIRARLRMTVTPTMVHGGVKENIIPSECEAVFDCRVLPGQNTSQAMDRIKDLLKDIGLDNLQFETIHAAEPSESSMNTPLYELIVEVMKEFEPNCGVSPVMLTGGTDSRFFRAVGSECYGFHPVLPETSYSQMQETIHGIDERISINNLVLGTSILYSIVERFMT